jgi:hypothetical protein
MKPQNVKAHFGKDTKDIRCECDGQVACGGTVHNLVDLGIGFRQGKLRIDRTYSKQSIGYSGFCLKCFKEGHFILPEFHKLLNAA